MAAGQWGAGRRTALYDRHVAAGGRMVDFAGWDMPVEYRSGGVLAEHASVRERVGVFDVSHLGKIAVTGAGARQLLDRVVTNDLAPVPAGGARYTLLCTEDGGVTDDMIAYVRGEDDVLLVPNAANADRVAGVVAAASGPGVSVTDRHAELAVVAVQGPRSADVLDAVGLPHDMAYMSFVTVASPGPGGGALVCRSGYTGELGYEVIIDSAAAPALWDALLAEVTRLGGLPCGLGARDTLRTEMAYPLHGQDISPEVSPLEAGLSWAIGWSKPDFPGRDALLAQRAAGPSRRLVGLVLTDKGVPRPGMSVRRPGQDPDAPAAGTLTSGTFSPTLRTGIALALVSAGAGLAEGDDVVVDIRGRPCRARVSRTPFVPSHVR